MAALVSGCSASSGGSSNSSASKVPEPPLRTGTPLGVQLISSDAQMKRYPFRTLAPFEHAVDLAFLRSVGAAPAIDPSRAHTGSSSLLLKAGARSASVRLASLLSGVSWPGQWTLLGAYVYSPQPQRLRAIYDIDQVAAVEYELQLPAGRWTPVLLDISTLRGEASRRIGSLRFEFADGLMQPVWIDDMVLINNENRIVPPGDEPAAAGGWTITQRGFAHYVERPGGFSERLPMPQADASGWTLQEANVLRARFTSNGPVKQRVMYSDGRQYVDGRYEPLGQRIEVVDEAIERQHAAAAEVQVKGGAARINRTHEGDVNNDGYAESLGAYQVIAGGPRLEIALAPRERTPLTTPVIEIAGLPAGEVLANVDGTLIERLARLENGNVLLQLPGAIGRTVTVSVRIRR